MTLHYQLVVVELRSSFVRHEPPGGSTDSRTSDVAPDRHVPEEQPATDQRFLRVSRRFVHDVQIGRVEPECCRRQSVGDEVDPEQLNGYESLGHAERRRQEDANHLADVGRDQIADELFHVVVDGTALFDCRHDGREVVVGEHHLRGRLGDRRSRSHGDSDLGLLEGWGIVDSVASL